MGVRKTYYNPLGEDVAYWCAQYGIPISHPRKIEDRPSMYAVGSFDYFDGLEAGHFTKAETVSFVKGYRHAMKNLSHFVRGLIFKGRHYEPAPTRVLLHIFHDMVVAASLLNQARANSGDVVPNDSYDHLVIFMRDALERQDDFFPVPLHDADNVDRISDATKAALELKAYLKVLLPVFINLLYKRRRIPSHLREAILAHIDKL